jgi:LysM repeat protein
MGSNQERLEIMVDSPKDNREDFVISENENTEEEEDLGREDYYGNQTGILQTKSNRPYIIGGIGLVIIVILLVMVLSRPSDVVDGERLQTLEERIQKLEKKLATIDVIGQAFDRIDNNEKELNLIMERVDRFEGTITTQIDQIIKELGKLHQKTGSAPPPKAKAVQPVAKSTTEKKMTVHEVGAGDTLYSISRRYGLTVDQLRKYNNIDKDAAIRPGQKLKLSPP